MHVNHIHEKAPNNVYLLVWSSHGIIVNWKPPPIAELKGVENAFGGGCSLVLS